jgi:hypothetical protein
LVKRRFFVERHHGPLTEGATSFSHHALDDRIGGGAKPGAKGAFCFSSVVSAVLVPLDMSLEAAATPWMKDG